MVSVIIPTYNRANTITRAVDSVLKQTYSDIEVLVIDDCSTDNTEDIVKSMNDSRLRYYKLERNGGACVARNVGIDHAKGEIIAFHDSDDIWYPNKLERQIGALEESRADICFCNLQRHYYDQQKPDEIYPGGLTTGFVSHHDCCMTPLASTQTIIAYAHVCREHQFDPKVKKTQDYDWLIRASKNYRVFFVEDILAEQFMQSDSISLGGYKKSLEARQYFLEKYKDEFLDDPIFEIRTHYAIAKFKTMLGLHAADDYLWVYRKEKSIRSLLMFLLSKVGLLKTMYRISGEKDVSR